MVNWTFPNAQYRPPAQVDVSPLARLADTYRQNQQEAYRREQMAKQQQYQMQRDAAGDQRAERSFGLQAQNSKEMMDFRKSQAEAEAAYRQQTLGLQRDQLAQARMPKPTAGIQEYEFAMKQQAAAGQPPVPFSEWKRMNSKAGATQVNVGGQQTKGQDETDKAFGKEYAEFVAGGGFADAVKNLGQLKGTIKELKSGKELSGFITGNMPDAVNSVMNPAAVDVRERVEEVVQRNLRLILGAQFTNEEGKRLIARAYNPKLSEKVNATRLERLTIAMEQALKAKMAAAKYYEQNGTLTSYQGSALFTMNDIEKAAGLSSDTKGGGQSEESEPDPSRVQSILNKYGIE